jgi:hypothetical protein
MRSQIINDIFSLAESNKISPTKPFEIIKYMPLEDEYLPWSVLLDRLQFFIDLIEATEVYGNLRDYLIELIKPLYLKLTWSSSQNESWLNRSDFIYCV